MNRVAIGNISTIAFIQVLCGIQKRANTQAKSAVAHIAFYQRSNYEI